MLLDLQVRCADIWGTNNGLIDLMGVNLSKTNIKSVSALDGILCEEGIGDCVISKNPAQEGTLRTYHTIFSDFPNHKFTSNSDAISDVIMYRKALSSLPQGVKCDIVCVGLLNSISRLLYSTSDSYSHLNGIDLVREKVNRLWVMGGDFEMRSILELLVFICGFVVVKRQTLKESIIMLAIGIVLAFVLNLLIPFHFG